MKDSMFLLLLLFHQGYSFFFPTSGGGNCGCAPVAPVCPPVAPVCTPPVCPQQPVCQQQSQSYTVAQPVWTSGVPAPAASYPSYSVDTSSYMVTNNYAQPSYPSYSQSAVVPPSPVYVPINIPQPPVTYIESGPAQNTQYGNGYTSGVEYQPRVDIPVNAYKEESAVEVGQPQSSPTVAPGPSYSTLIPSYTETQYQSRVPASSYDDTEPPALPPLPDQTAAVYKTDEALQSMPPPGYQSGSSVTAIPLRSKLIGPVSRATMWFLQDKMWPLRVLFKLCFEQRSHQDWNSMDIEKQRKFLRMMVGNYLFVEELMKTRTPGPALLRRSKQLIPFILLSPQALYDQQKGVHSGINYGPQPPSTGYEPANSKRYIVLKKMKTARTMGARIPRTNATCNSKHLSNVMNRAMVDDVSVSKRMVLRATELAFEGAKYDVFCATGEFSYSIHSRKYCEVTKNDITCFAFR